MPTDEFDFEDPFELNGMAFMTHEDTTNDMAETFIEEFTRMGLRPQTNCCVNESMRAVASLGYSKNPDGNFSRLSSCHRLTVSQAGGPRNGDFEE